MKVIRTIIKVLDNVVDIAILSILLILLAYGVFVLMDTEQMYDKADSSQYSIYRPAQEDSISFEELRAINPEVFGWLTVYGTNIDYPLVQADDNDKYVNTDAKGNYAASGSIFLDCRNRNDFSDFNSIIYGHHMDKQVMFGDITSFSEKDYFNTHRYGIIYYGGKTYGIEFFAFLEAEASGSLFKPGIEEPEEAEEWLDDLMQKAIHVRETDVGIDDHIVLLTTCTWDITNGRHVLAGKLMKDVPENPFQGMKDELQEEKAPALSWVKIVVPLVLLILLAVGFSTRRRYKKGREK